MTSFTSYGRNVSLNFFFATWNFMILHTKEDKKLAQKHGEGDVVNKDVITK